MRLTIPRAKPPDSAHASESCSIRRRDAPAGRGRLPLRTSCTLSQIRLLRPCRVRAYRFASGAGFVTAPYSPSKNATRPTDPQGAGATGRVSVPGSESPRATNYPEPGIAVIGSALPVCRYLDGPAIGSSRNSVGPGCLKDTGTILSRAYAPLRSVTRTPCRRPLGHRPLP
jgi:hypothetical protein